MVHRGIYHVHNSRDHYDIIAVFYGVRAEKRLATQNKNENYSNSEILHYYIPEQWQRVYNYISDKSQQYCRLKQKFTFFFFFLLPIIISRSGGLSVHGQSKIVRIIIETIQTDLAMEHNIIIIL